MAALVACVLDLPGWTVGVGGSPTIRRLCCLMRSTGSIRAPLGSSAGSGSSRRHSTNLNAAFAAHSKRQENLWQRGFRDGEATLHDLTAGGVKDIMGNAPEAASVASFAAQKRAEIAGSGLTARSSISGASTRSR